MLSVEKPVTDHQTPQPPPRLGPWPHRLAWLLACATFPLILVGATVTGYGAGMSVPDWPTTYGYWFYPLKLWIVVWDLFLEHGHRMLAEFVVGPLTIALTVLVWRSDRRTWMRGLVLAALAGVIFQGTLGGLRVIADQRLLARIHGCTAPLFFTLCAVLAAVTSRRWPSGIRGPVHFSARIRLLWALVLAIYLEIVLGTQLRVPSIAVGGNWFQLLVWVKVINAALIAAGLAWLWLETRRSGGLSHVSFDETGTVPLAGAQRMLATRVRLLAVLFMLQIILACATWVTHYGWPAWFSRYFTTINYTVVETGRWQVVLTTLHVGAGSLCLALAATILLWSYVAGTRRVPSASYGTRRVPAT